jgi:hypothetical protein
MKEIINKENREDSRKKYLQINFNPSSYQSASNEPQHATARFVT